MQIRNEMNISRVSRVILVLFTLLTSLMAFADDEGKMYLQKANAQYEAGHYDVAVAYYLKAAEFNEVEAMFDIGYALYHGEGITQDYPSAAMWFKRAANLHYPKAEYNLAFCYMNGQGVPCDYEKALKWLVSSANNGFSQAQLTLSECYEHGILVEQDLAESKRWKRLADANMEKSKSMEVSQLTQIDEPVQKPTTNGLPSFDIQLDGELHEREDVSATPSVTTTVVKPVQPKHEEDQDLTKGTQEHTPIILYPPGVEPPKNAPVLKILYPRDQSFFHTEQIKVKYQLLADGLEDSTKVIAMVDAVKIDQNNSRAVKQANTLDVDVPNRDCTVTLYAKNRIGNSEPVSIRLIRENVAQGNLPRLFCVVIGIGDYHDEKLPPLKLSIKDARDFAEVVAKKKGLPFSEVQVKLLVDKEATRSDFFEALEWLQQETTPNDVCIFFYAGHGYRDEKDRFYFMPYGGTTDKLYNCFSATDFRNMAEDINCKLIIFADACYSAALFEGNRSAATTHFIEQLRRTKNGMVLYASSASDTKSKEDLEWGNGAFTKALVAAFNGGARQQFDEGLSTQTLDAYLYKEVRRITNFKQTPIFINPNGMEHFNIFTYDE